MVDFDNGARDFEYDIKYESALSYNICNQFCSAEEPEKEDAAAAL